MSLQVDLLVQPSQGIAAEFRKMLAPGCRVDIASAYVSQHGVRDLLGDVPISQARIVCTVHGFVSDLPALRDWEACDPETRSARVSTSEALFHPKVYIIHTDEGIAAMVGSANATQHGLHGNVEVCVVLHASASEHPLLELTSFYERVWTTESVAVSDYLREHRDYRHRPAADTDLSALQVEALERLRGEESTVEFTKDVKAEMRRRCVVTVPQSLRDLLDASRVCAFKRSIPIDIAGPDCVTRRGRLRHQSNNGARYYQFQLSHASDAREFRATVSGVSRLSFRLRLEDGRVEVLGPAEVPPAG